MAFKNKDIPQLIEALGGMLGGGAGLAGIGGAGGMMLDPNDPSSYWGEFEGTGFNINPGDPDAETPIGLPIIDDPPYDTPTEIPPIFDPPPPYDTPTEIPPIIEVPPPRPLGIPTDIDTGSITPPASPGQIPPQFSMPNFNFPMPDINPLVGGPNMGPVGFYSVNSGAAGLPVPAYGGLENPNMLSNYVQQFVGGPNVLSRSLNPYS